MINLETSPLNQVKCVLLGQGSVYLAIDLQVPVDEGQLRSDYSTNNLLIICNHIYIYNPRCHRLLRFTPHFITVKIGHVIW